MFSIVYNIYIIKNNEETIKKKIKSRKAQRKGRTTKNITLDKF